MVWVSNLLLAPQSAKLKLKWFKAFNTREFFVISLLHTSSLIRSHTHTITTRNAISVPKLFHLSWIFSFSFKDVFQWKQSKSGLRIEIHYVCKNGTEWHENKSKSGTFYDLRAIFFWHAGPPTIYTSQIFEIQNCIKNCILNCTLAFCVKDNHLEERKPFLPVQYFIYIYIVRVISALTCWEEGSMHTWPKRCGMKSRFYITKKVCRQRKSRDGTMEFLRKQQSIVDLRNTGYKVVNILL